MATKNKPLGQVLKTSPEASKVLEQIAERISGKKLFTSKTEMAKKILSNIHSLPEGQGNL